MTTCQLIENIELEIPNVASISKDTLLHEPWKLAVAVGNAILNAVQYRTYDGKKLLLFIC